jgi:ABC-type phosphate transport system permease subunit
VAVIDDVLYAIGGGASRTFIDFLSVNEQYIPNDYSTIPSTTSEPSKPITSPATSESSDASSERTLTYLVAAGLVITVVSVTAVSLVFYSKKRKMVH